MSKKTIEIIACTDIHLGIGKGNDLLYRIPADLHRFKDITMGHAVLMGRKTFESIGKPLSGRENLVVSRSSTYRESLAEQFEDVRMFSDVHYAIENSHSDKIFCIGGDSLYRRFLLAPYTSDLYNITKIHLTKVHFIREADSHFPIDPDHDIRCFKHQDESGEIQYSHFPDSCIIPYEYKTYDCCGNWNPDC